MCGICGFVKIGEPANAGVLRRMNNAIKHRGPDDEGYFCIGTEPVSFAGADTVTPIKQHLPQLNPDVKVKVGMGFRRLSILDLSPAGHQPMLSDDGQIALTFNGEIYNFKELRSELINTGFRFNSNTDTEVVLRGYECWGKAVLDRLNGMFALAISDNRNGKVWLVRDRLGMKPLFYHHSGADITWASEMKSILKADWVRPVINEEGLIGNYYLQSSASPATCFENIFALMPGTWMEIDTRSLNVTRETYWHIPIGATDIKLSLEEAGRELEDRLSEAVRMQLYADVPLVSMMSGGVDSTTITAIGHRLDASLACYSLGIDGTGEGLDELPQATAMAEKLGITQKIHLIKSEELISGLDAGLRHFEEPYIAPEVILSASKFLHDAGYKVVLSGNGADEVFGGYPQVLRLADWRKRRLVGGVAPWLPRIGSFLKKVKNYLGVDTNFRYYGHSRSAMRPYQIEALLGNGGGSKVRAILLNLQEDETRFRNDYEASFYYDLKYSVGAHHVYRDDLSAMRYGLEMRYPYLDHTLIEWVAKLPLSLRYNGAISKPLLRAAAAQYVDGTNLSMPKKGFNLPVADWWNNGGEVRRYMDRQLALLKKRGIFNNRTIDGWQRSSHTAFELSKIWQLVTTEIWMQTYID